jgi:hypothetical protein
MVEISAHWNDAKKTLISATIDGEIYLVPGAVVKTFLRDAKTDEVSTNFRWTSGNAYRQMIADVYDNAGVPIPDYVEPPPTAADTARAARRSNADAKALRARLLNATDAQIDQYVETNATTLAAARTMFKQILKIIAADMRED